SLLTLIANTLLPNKRAACSLIPFQSLRTGPPVSDGKAAGAAIDVDGTPSDRGHVCGYRPTDNPNLRPNSLWDSTPSRRARIRCRSIGNPRCLSLRQLFGRSTTTKRRLASGSPRIATPSGRRPETPAIEKDPDHKAATLSSRWPTPTYQGSMRNSNSPAC